MDSKITLNFDKDIINKAKEFAAQNNVSLSRLVEFLLQKATSTSINSLEDYPIADWVNELAEGEGTYFTKHTSRRDLKNEYFSSAK
jgi:hypothetical protein